MTEPLTLVYSRVGDLDIHIDLYLPRSPPEQEVPLIPAVIFFHGGGMFRGNRKSILPEFKGRNYHASTPSTGLIHCFRPGGL